MDIDIHYYMDLIVIQGVAIKLSVWFYWKLVYILVPYWKRLPSKYSPRAATHLAQRCCHCWKYFWNSCCGTAFSAVVTFLGCLQHPEIFVPLRQTSFLETARIHLDSSQGNMVGVPFQ
jgi:hypothetical protein